MDLATGNCQHPALSHILGGKDFRGNCVQRVSPVWHVTDLQPSIDVETIVWVDTQFSINTILRTTYIAYMPSEKCLWIRNRISVICRTTSIEVVLHPYATNRKKEQSHVHICCLWIIVFWLRVIAGKIRNGKPKWMLRRVRANKCAELPHSM